jgi:predicted HAD superfamily Cof-like phosphohydrolase
MTSNFELVKAFHRAFGAPTADKPTGLDSERATLRINLICEELDEYVEAVGKGDLAEVADALADLLYVVYGTSAEHGLPIDECFAEVHRSNMTKLGEDGKPVRREDGKILKGPRFEPPLLKGLLNV